MADMDQIDSYVMVPMVQTAAYVEFPQLQSLIVVDFSCRGAQADSHGPAVQQTMMFPLLQFSDKVIGVLGMQVVQVCNDRCPPQLQFFYKFVDIPFVSHRHIIPWSCCSPDLEIPLLPYTWWSMSLFTGQPGDLVGEAKSQPEQCTDTATNILIVQGYVCVLRGRWCMCVLCVVCCLGCRVCKVRLLRCA